MAVDQKKVSELTSHEKELLCDCAGYETTIKGWGSWFMTAVGALRAAGLMDRCGDSYEINADGRRVADELAVEMGFVK